MVPTPPGTLITLSADVSINGSIIAACEEYVVVVNPLFQGQTFFYDLNRPWREIFAGVHVRFLLRVSPNGKPETFEGWTLRDGRVLTEHGIVNRKP
jgi:hypothetical protein